MFILYAYADGKWREFAAFPDKRDFAAQVKTAFMTQLREGKTQQIKNAAVVLADFVLGGKYYDASYGKLIKRALRNFDELGLCNDIFDSLEELLDEGCERFALARSEAELALAKESKPKIVI